MPSTITRPFSRLTIALAVAATLAPALASAKDKLVANGKPVNCLQINTIRSTEVRDDRTIDFTTIGNKVYRNMLPNSCPSLGAEKRFLYKTSQSQLCSVDIITVLYQTPNLSRGASCGLGQFQPMAKAK